MARKTTTTTVVYSEKKTDGTWQEMTKSVTTVVERDDEGYPYGPVRPSFPYNPYVTWNSGNKRFADYVGGHIGNYFDLYDSRGARPAAKKTEDEPQQPEDGTDG